MENKVRECGTQHEEDFARFHHSDCANKKILVANCCENNDVALNSMDWMRRALESEALVKPLALFWASVREYIFEGISDEDAQEWASAAGLLVSVPYNPEVHGEDVEGAEPGDDIFVDSDVSFAAKKIIENA